MTTLRKGMTISGLVAVAIGSCIGSGIFKTPSDIAYQLPQVEWILGIWLLGGMIALCGALSFSELSGMFPGAGGVYVYLREIYGRMLGFLYGWSILLVITSGALAALAMIFASYLVSFIPGAANYQELVAALCIALLTLWNIRGVEWGDRMARFATAAKLLGIAGIILVGLLLGDKEVSSSSSVTEAGNSLWPPAKAAAAALVGVFFSFGGWHHASYMAGEIKNPTKNVPRAMILGVSIVTVAYLLINVAYIKMLPISEIASSEVVAADALKTIWDGGAQAVSLLVLISIFGTIAIYTQTAPRIYYRMAADGIFFKPFARIHPNYQTPHIAMTIQATWSIVLIFLLGTFQNLITYVTFIDLLFMSLCGVGIIYLRYRKPDLERTYRTPLFPLLPLIFVVVNVWFLGLTLKNEPEALWGSIVLGLGAVVYVVRNAMSGRNDSQESRDNQE
jgi:APA family basic amino acid/polyamine antiporter